MTDKKSEFGFDFQAWQKKLETANFDLSFNWSDSVAQMRRLYVQMSRAIERNVPIMKVVDDVVMLLPDCDLKGRLYIPEQANEPGPGIVYFHGGGFVLGDLESFDTICRRLADASGCRVFSVNYRLAPEHKFPVPVDDALSAYEWVLANTQTLGFDAGHIAVAGDSAGGNLCINITRAALTGRFAMPCFQLLIYPLTQFVDIRKKGLKVKEGALFSAEVFELFRKAYLPKDQDPMDERISPLFAASFKGLPPAHFVSAGLDPLYDEGQTYKKKLEASGVRTTQRHYPLQPHGFFNLTAFSGLARDAIKEAGELIGHELSNQRIRDEKRAAS